MLNITPIDGSFDLSPALLVNTDSKPEYHPTVHDIPPDERPRERLQKLELIHSPHQICSPSSYVQVQNKKM